MHLEEVAYVQPIVELLKSLHALSSGLSTLFLQTGEKHLVLGRLLMSD